MKKGVGVFLLLGMFLGASQLSAVINLDDVFDAIYKSRGDVCGKDSSLYLNTLTYLMYAPKENGKDFKTCLQKGYKSFGQHIEKVVQARHNPYSKGQIKMLTALYMLAQKRLYQRFKLPEIPANDLTKLLSPLTDNELINLFTILIYLELYDKQGAAFIEECLMEDYVHLQEAEETLKKQHQATLSKLQEGRKLTDKEKALLKERATGDLKKLNQLVNRKNIGHGLQLGHNKQERPLQKADMPESSHKCASDKRLFLKAVLADNDEIDQTRKECITGGLQSKKLVQFFQNINPQASKTSPQSQLTVHLFPSELLLNYARFLVGVPQNPYPLTTDERLKKAFHITKDNAEMVKNFLHILFDLNKRGDGGMSVPNFSIEGWELLLRCKVRAYDKEQAAKKAQAEAEQEANIAALANRHQRKIDHVGTGDLAALQRQLQEQEAQKALQEKQTHFAKAAAQRVREHPSAPQREDSVSTHPKSQAEANPFHTEQTSVLETKVQMLKIRWRNIPDSEKTEKKVELRQLLEALYEKTKKEKYNPEDAAYKKYFS